VSASPSGTWLRELLSSKRDGAELSAEQSLQFLSGVADGTVGEPEQVALLASIWFRGMAPAELSGWTRGMVASGETLDLSAFDAPKVDKHSTGGIGDKVSLPLAPALAALGCIVPMISGRGLGHTGGTLDKLEAIPGFTTGLDEAAIQRVLREAGCVICAQTRSIAPSDRVLYALRDRVELVESLPLIASSISKRVKRWSLITRANSSRRRHQRLLQPRNLKPLPLNNSANASTEYITPNQLDELVFFAQTHCIKKDASKRLLVGSS